MNEFDYLLDPKLIDAKDVIIEDITFERDCYLDYLVNSQTTIVNKHLEREA